MKKVTSLFLVAIMLVAMLPTIAFADSALIFTWAWDKDMVDVDGSASVVSWSGGNNQSYRSAFAVFDVPGNFAYNKETTIVTAKLTIKSARLNNGKGEAPNAAIILVDGESVKKAYSMNNAEGGKLLKAAKQNGIYKATYEINSTAPADKAVTMDITEYFDKYPNAKTVGINLTNIAADEFVSKNGIATEMSDITLEFSVIDDRTVKEQKAQEVKADEAATLNISKKGTIYTATNGGYSGSAFGKGIFVATGDHAHGVSIRAKNVSSVSHSGKPNVLGSSRVGALEFEIDPTIDPAKIGTAEVYFYVNSVHGNLGGNWMRLAFYETTNPKIENYTLGGMDDTLYLHPEDDYSAKSTYWSDEKLKTDFKGWTKANVTPIITNALDAYRKNKSTDEKIRVVIRMLVPFAGVNIDDTTSENAPFLNVTMLEESLHAKYDFESLTDGKVKDMSNNGFDATLLDDAKVENGQLVLNGNGGAKIDHPTFCDALSSYTVVTTVQTVGPAVKNTRIYDFGANSSNSGFLRVKDFAAGLKYNNGNTTFVGKNMGEINPFEKGDTPYHVAVSYDNVRKTTTIYINGEKITESSSIKRGLNEFKEKTGNNLIGRTLWYYANEQAKKDNPDIKAKYDDFVVYNEALTERAIYSLYNGGFEKNVEETAAFVAEYVKPLTEAPVKEGKEFFTKHTTADGTEVKVEWFTSDAEVVDKKGNVFRGFEDATAEVYAIISLGGYSIRTDIVTITAAGYSQDEMNTVKLLKYGFNTEGTVVEGESGKNSATALTQAIQKDGRANLKKDNVIKLADSINAGVVDYTVAFNVRCDDLTREGQTIYTFGMEEGKAQGSYCAFTKVNTDGTLTVGINNNGEVQTVTSKKKLATSEWNHITVAYSKATGNTYIYINGVLDVNSTDIKYTMAGAMVNSKSDFNYIGRSHAYKAQGETNPDFTGKIDNFEFYNVCLSAKAVASLATQPQDGPMLEMTNAFIIDGMNRAIVNVESSVFEGEAEVRIETIGKKKTVDKQVVFIKKGRNSYSMDLSCGAEGRKSVNITLWDVKNSAKPLCDNEISITYTTFDYDYATPDNTLLSNTFSLKSYDAEKYLSLVNDISVEEWKDDNDNLLWSSPYVHKVASEGYYAFRNADGTSYVTIDGDNVTTAEKSNWRFVQIEPEKVGGKKNVVAIYEKATGKYLARSGNTVIATAKAESRANWWVLEIKAYDTFAQMLATPGFMALSANERERLCGVTAQAFWQSSYRRDRLLTYMGEDYFEVGANEQAGRLRKIFSFVASQQVNRTVSKGTTGAHGTYELGEFQANVEYRGTDNEPYRGYMSEVTYYTDADKTGIEQVVKIYAPEINQVKQIAEGFSFHPYQFRKNIKSVRRYKHSANEFNCGADTMYVRGETCPDAWMFAMVSAHELGHSLDFSGGYRSTWGEAYDARSRDINKVSGYGNSNTYEDFAEFTQFVISCSGDPVMLKMVKEMFPGRFDILADILNDQNNGNGLLNVAYE